jgi:sugar lactone lactonase YvrE
VTRMYNLLMASAMSLCLLIDAAAAQEETLTIGSGVYPESIASTPQGDLLIGSFARGTVFRVSAGQTMAKPWITGIGPVIAGVFAQGDTAYVCDNGAFGAGQASLKTYSLASAAETGSYDFPDGGFCSDIAVSPAGAVYATDLQFIEGQPGRLLRLTESGLEVVLADIGIRGIDGIAFVGETLIANDLFTGALHRINLEAEPASFATLALSEPLAGPDGMRTSEDGAGLLVVEQYGNRLVSVTVDGDSAKITEIAKGFDGPAGVAQIGNKAYIVEAHFDEMQAAGAELSTHMVREVPLP